MVFIPVDLKVKMVELFDNFRKIQEKEATKEATRGVTIGTGKGNDLQFRWVTLPDKVGKFFLQEGKLRARLRFVNYTNEKMTLLHFQHDFVMKREIIGKRETVTVQPNDWIMIMRRNGGYIFIPSI